MSVAVKSKCKRRREEYTVFQKKNAYMYKDSENKVKRQKKHETDLFLQNVTMAVSAKFDQMADRILTIENRLMHMNRSICQMNKNMQHLSGNVKQLKEEEAKRNTRIEPHQHSYIS